MGSDDVFDPERANAHLHVAQRRMVSDEHKQDGPATAVWELPISHQHSSAYGARSGGSQGAPEAYERPTVRFSSEVHVVLRAGKIRQLNDEAMRSTVIPRVLNVLRNAPTALMTERGRHLKLPDDEFWPCSDTATLFVRPCYPAVFETVLNECRPKKVLRDHHHIVTGHPGIGTSMFGYGLLGALAPSLNLF